jgi:hypothetical protein
MGAIASITVTANGFINNSMDTGTSVCPNLSEEFLASVLLPVLIKV